MAVILKSNLTFLYAFATANPNNINAPTHISNIRPGTNHLAQKDYARLLENPDFQAEIKRGKLEIISGVEPDKEPSPDSPDQKTGEVLNLEKLSAKDSIGIIEQTEDTQLLRTWQGVEVRATVVNAISHKLNQIEKYREKMQNKKEQKQHDTETPNS